MAAVRKFFPTWRVSTGGAIAIAGGAIGAALAIPNLTPGGTLRGMLVAALSLVLAAGLFALVVRFVPVKATVDGVMATRGFSVRSRLVRWREIKAVVPTSANGLRQLRLVHDSPFPEDLFMLMHLDDLSPLRAFVAAHAGEQHPLAIWLSAEVSASNLRRVETSS